MWRGQYNALMALIVVPALGIAGYLSVKSGDWSGFLAVVGIWIIFSLVIGTVNFFSKAFRGKPIIYDGRIDSKTTKR